jgi:hypothetical protein
VQQTSVAAQSSEPSHLNVAWVDGSQVVEQCASEVAVATQHTWFGNLQLVVPQ